MPVICIIMVVVLALTAFGQTDTGAIAGTVTDASGASVASAEAVARNQGTGAAFRGVSNETGNFVISALPPGRYDVSVSAAGFAKSSRTGVTVNVQSRVEVNFALKVGEVTEVIDVTAEAPVLEHQNSSIGQVVENKAVVTLPLNGRNYSQLVSLMPGATPNPPSTATDGVSLNGNRMFQNVYLIDGIDNNNYILGVDTNSTQALRPSIDAIQEFKVEAANYSAEFGRAAGGVISVSIKSGTNKLHGSAFEFLRNDKLDANNFFSNRAGRLRPPLRRNQFGGTVGGPVIRNRTFFFASYQGTRVREPNTLTTTVPIGGMAQGDFGNTPIYDPLNVVNGVRQPFANNAIPAGRLDPVGRKLATLYPRPNLPGSVNNFVSNVANSDREDQSDFRVDHQLCKNNSLFFRYSNSDREIAPGSLFGVPGNGNSPLILPPQAYSLVLNDTHVFSPTIVNEFRAGYTNNFVNRHPPAERSYYEEFGIRGVPPFPGQTGLPNFSVAGFAALGDSTFAPNPKRAQVRQFIDNLSWVHGDHTVKFGIDSRFAENFSRVSATARGSFSLNGQFTSRLPGQGAGSGLADLLLGQTSNAALSTILPGDLRHRFYGMFIDDTWRITRKWTLNLGLRYELQSPSWERHNNQSNFELDPRSPNYGKLVQASGSGILSRTFSNRDTNNVSPRFGFAYQLNSKTVLRAAAGIFYGGWGDLAIINLPPANLPNYIAISVPTANTAAVSTVVLKDGFPSGAVSVQNVQYPTAVAVLPNWPLPEVYQWNIGIQRELVPNTVMTLSYVGSGSSYLWGYSNINSPEPGPGAIQTRRPFPAYSNIMLTSAFAHSTYHSLQAKVERRFNKGFSVLSSYTWSHSIDNSINEENNRLGATTPQDPLNTNAEKSNSVTDMPHRWVTSAIYDVPFGRTGGLFGGNPGLRVVLSGWELGGIFAVSSGTPMTPGLSVNPANTGGTIRPDRLRDGNLPRGERTVDRWFDPSAFALSAPFTFGNSGRHVLRAPGLVNLDALIGRNFKIGETRRLEFRAEFFNLTNTAHFGRPDLSINLPQAGRIGSALFPNRQAQLGMRFVY